MPPDGPTEWTTTLRDTGRLVIRARRFPILMLVVWSGLLITNGTSTVARLTGAEPWGGLAYFRAVFALVALIVVAGFLFYLLTGAWTLTIDAEGVTLGRRHLAWPAITAISATEQAVTVHGDANLRITGNTLKDPKAFARWLTTELETHR
ncbi:hypothetical protein [Kribbella italica]|uniref:Uncharacterized protein n=1 Tax=Kribbella italica TaxID=1540520 RepID=A0A7W9JF01_9ACTN|nr:hypothetical protein [Kribbella italica]MBB5840744.1 hypothetical protein [Kribbella italica]